MEVCTQSLHYRSEKFYLSKLQACTQVLQKVKSDVFMLNLISGDKLLFLTRDFRQKSDRYPLFRKCYLRGVLLSLEDVRGSSCNVWSVGWSEWIGEGGVCTLLVCIIWWSNTTASAVVA